MNDRVEEAALLRAAAPAEPMTQDELIDVLASSMYPGAKRESVAMVLGYCRAAGLDPMQKPVHLVPMRVKTGQKNQYGDEQYAFRDTVMPGIGLYRVQAARTGQYAGMDEPKFGPMRTLTYMATVREWVEVPGQTKKRPHDTFVEKTLEYPEWCSITVYRLVGGFRSAWTAVEYWTENYATAGRDSEAPNEMWAKRTRGQLAKCAEAQALRKGFPEVGSQPTAEEMEGKTLDLQDFADPPAAPEQRPMPRRASEAAAGPALTDDRAAQAENTLQQPVQQEKVAEPVARAATLATKPAAAPSGNSSSAPADDGTPASYGERKNVMVTANARRKNLAAILAELGIAADPAKELEGLTRAQFKAVKARL